MSEEDFLEMSEEDFFKKLEECKKIIASTKVKMDKEIFYKVDDSKILLEWQKEKIKKFINEKKIEVLRMFAMKRLEDNKILLYIIATEGKEKDFEYRVFFPEENKAKYKKREIRINANFKNMSNEIKKINFKSECDILEYSICRNNAIMNVQVVNGTANYNGDINVVCKIHSEGVGVGPKFYQENFFTEENIDISDVKYLTWIVAEYEDLKEIVMKELYDGVEQEKVEKCKKLFDALQEEGEKLNKELEEEIKKTIKSEEKTEK